MRNSRRHILLVEDNRDIRAAFVTLFEGIYDYALHAVDGTQGALGVTSRQNIDVAVVDLASGPEVSARLAMIRMWRRDGLAFPVIATSPQEYDGLLVETLDAGGDDFLRKPYLFSELRARIQRQLARRLNSTPKIARIDGVALPDEPFVFGEAVISPDMRITFPSGRIFRLTAKQMGILREFNRHAGALLLKEKLIYAVWGADANTNSSSVHQYLHILRKLYHAGGIDLNTFVTVENKAGWRIAEEVTEPSLSGLKT